MYNSKQVPIIRVSDSLKIRRLYIFICITRDSTYIFLLKRIYLCKIKVITVKHICINNYDGNYSKLDNMQCLILEYIYYEKENISENL